MARITRQSPMDRANRSDTAKSYTPASRARRAARRAVKLARRKNR